MSLDNALVLYWLTNYLTVVYTILFKHVKLLKAHTFVRLNHRRGRAAQPNDVTSQTKIKVTKIIFFFFCLLAGGNLTYWCITATNWNGVWIRIFACIKNRNKHKKQAKQINKLENKTK